jgi:hypothetical protein
MIAWRTGADGARQQLILASKEFKDEINAELARLPDKPDEDLR